eukprot:1162088-Pelagomonas_calceolata.AAC.9
MLACMVFPANTDAYTNKADTDFKGNMQTDADSKCAVGCVSQKCYNELFPEPIEDGEVISYQNTRLKRCLREEAKMQRAAEAQKDKERKRGDVL